MMRLRKVSLRESESLRKHAFSSLPIRFAWFAIRISMILTWHLETGDERITSKAGPARAYGIVIDRLASRVAAAQSTTGIAALILNAR